MYFYLLFAAIKSQEQATAEQEVTTLRCGNRMTKTWGQRRQRSGGRRGRWRNWKTLLRNNGIRSSWRGTNCSEPQHWQQLAWRWWVDRWFVERFQPYSQYPNPESINTSSSWAFEGMKVFPSDRYVGTDYRKGTTICMTDALALCLSAESLKARVLQSESTSLELDITLPQRVLTLKRLNKGTSGSM